MSERLKSNTSENSDWLEQWNKIADDERIDKFKENAAQELMERELNSELTKVDDLINAARVDEEGITSRRVTLNYPDGSQKKVGLIILEGYPLKTLQTSISIDNVNDMVNPENYGQSRQTADVLRDDPSFWMKNQNEVEGLGKTTSATFSASYFDTESGITTMTGHGCCYAFDHVRPNSLVEVSKVDGNTSLASNIQQPILNKNADNIRAIPETYLAKDINQKEKPPLALSELADFEGRSSSDFNELLFNRYNELGQPQKPDYILTRGNVNNNYGINELTARHALYHNIPIVCIVPEKYKNIKDDYDFDFSFEESDSQDLN